MDPNSKFSSANINISQPHSAAFRKTKCGSLVTQWMKEEKCLRSSHGNVKIIPLCDFGEEKAIQLPLAEKYLSGYSKCSDDEEYSGSEHQKEYKAETMEGDRRGLPHAISYDHWEEAEIDHESLSGDEEEDI